jgi:hypothetical protein
VPLRVHDRDRRREAERIAVGVGVFDRDPFGPGLKAIDVHGTLVGPVLGVAKHDALAPWTINLNAENISHREA